MPLSSVYLEPQQAGAPDAKGRNCPLIQIIKKLPVYKGPSWTKLRTEEDYRKLVKAAKVKAQGVPLAAWELETYNYAQR